VEIPAGKVAHETPGAISALRVSPDGGRVAFIEHRTPEDDEGRVMVLGPGNPPRARGPWFNSTRGWPGLLTAARSARRR